MLHFYKMGSHCTDLIIFSTSGMFCPKRCSFSICVTFEYLVDCVQLLLIDQKAGLEVLASAAVVKGPPVSIFVLETVPGITRKEMFC